jgi:hypothetical protein
MNKQLFYALLLSSLISFSQEKNDTLSSYNFLNHKYKFLTADFKIAIPDTVYKNNFKKYKYIEGREFKHSDSLGVVLMSEFNNWRTARIARNAILYEWVKIGYYLWITEGEAKKMGQSYGFMKPYAFRLFLDDDNKHDEKLKAFIVDLRKKVFLKTKNEEVKNMPVKKFLNMSFGSNPIMQEDRAKFMIARKKEMQIKAFEKEHGHLPNKDEIEHLGTKCTKKNCCQKG